MKLKLSSFREEKQILRAELTCDEIGLREEGLTDPVKVEVITAKNNSCLTVECNINIETNFVCDRCLKNYKSRLEAHTEFIITDDPRMKSDSDDILFVSLGEDIVDISKNLRDAVLLAYPLKKLCSQNCKGLCPHCGINLNFEVCQCHTEEIDPRWEKLKELKNK
jgi:uncharacterized protein